MAASPQTGHNVAPAYPVARYSAGDLAHELGSAWTLIAQAREEHVTPAGVVQPFTWAVARRHS